MLDADPQVAGISDPNGNTAIHAALEQGAPRRVLRTIAQLYPPAKPDADAELERRRVLARDCQSTRKVCPPLALPSPPPLPSDPLEGS